MRRANSDSEGNRAGENDRATQCHWTNGFEEKAAPNQGKCYAGACHKHLGVERWHTSRNFHTFASEAEQSGIGPSAGNSKDHVRFRVPHNGHHVPDEVFCRGSVSFAPHRASKEQQWRTACGGSPGLAWYVNPRPDQYSVSVDWKDHVQDRR